MPPREKRIDETGHVIPFPGALSRSASFKAIFHDHERQLHNFLRIRLGSDTEAQDALQLTFLRLWRRREVLRNENLTALLYVTARNIAVDMLRQRARMRSNLDDDAAEVENVQDPAAGPERALSAKQDLSLILKVIEELPDRCRTAFVRYKFHNMEYREIAQQMGVTESMVRKYVLKAVAHCAARFEELEGWE